MIKNKECLKCGALINKTKGIQLCEACNEQYKIAKYTKSGERFEFAIVAKKEFTINLNPKSWSYAGRNLQDLQNKR